MHDSGLVVNFVNLKFKAIINHMLDLVFSIAERQMPSKLLFCDNHDRLLDHHNRLLLLEDHVMLLLLD